MNKIFIHIFCIFLLAGMGCAKKQNSIFLTKEKAKEANDLFFKGVEMKNNAKWDLSVKNFEAYLQILPNEAAAHYEIARIQREQLLTPENALVHAKRAAELDKKNKWYGLELARCLGANNQLSASIKQYELLIKQDPTWTLPLLEIAESCSRNGELKQAIEALDQLEKINGVDPYFSRLKQELYIQFKDYNAAGAELEKLAAAFPDETSFTMQAAEFYLGINSVDKAKTVLENNPQISEGQKAFYEYKILSKNPKSHPQDILLALDKALELPDIDIDQRINALAPFVYNDQIQDNWKEVVGRCVEKTLLAFPNEAKAHSLAGDFFALNNQLAKAIAAYEKTVLLDPSKKVVWSALLDLYEEDNSSSPMEYFERGQEACNLFPFAPEFRKHTAQALFRMGELNSCIDECNSGLAIIVDDPQTEAELYLMKLFSLSALNDKKSAVALTQLMSNKKQIMQINTVMQMGWINEFFELQQNNIREQLIYVINNQVNGKEIALHALQMRRGETIAEADFNKNSFFDNLNAALYFTIKKDQLAACKFLTEAKKKMPFNTWLNQINPECP